MTVPRLTLAVLVLVPFGAGAAPDRRIDISADPRQLELSPGARSTLRISSPEPPVVTASVGEVRPPRAVGKGRFEAVYLAPAETHPQVAIIVARTAGASGWLALPLAGNGEIEVSPDASGAATVTVGNRRFGPQRAGPEGKAVVRIVVPPGTLYAVSRGKRIKLNLPEVPHVYVSAGDAEVPTNVGGTIALRVFAVTPEGKPRSGAPLRLSVEPGTVSPVREVEPGAYEATWRLPPGSSATVTARLADEAPAHTATVPRSSPEPQRLRIEVDRPTVAAGDGTLDFTLVVEDGAGNPSDRGGPRVTISAGAFLGWSRGPPGRWVGHVAIPEHLDSTSLVIVGTVGELMARREVALVAGPAAEIELKGDGPSGAAPGPFSVVTRDRFGNPTDGEPPRATATHGTVTGPVRQGAGTYRFEYRPPLAAAASPDELRLSAGRAERVLAVGPRLEASLPRFELGAKGGLALASGTTGPVVGAELSVWTRGRPAQLGLLVNGSWFRFSHDRTIAAQPEPLAFHSRGTYLALTAGPAWRLAVGSRAMISASVGGGAVRVESSSRLGTQPTVGETAWVAGGTAAVSLGARVWGGYPHVEVRAAYVGDPHLDGLSGSFTPILLQLGYRIDAF